MIDTIKIFIPADQITSFYKTTGSQLLSHNNRIFEDEVEKQRSGNYKNLHVYDNYKGLSIHGSLAKFRYGTNQRTLNLLDTIKTIEEISEDLGLPLMDGKVLRVDFGENIVTKQPAENYYKVLGETKYFKKITLDNGIEYRTTKRCISIYGKIKELKIRNEPLTPLFTNRNILRYEYRLLNHHMIGKLLNLPTVTVRDVINNYQKFVDNWQLMFNAIYKNNDLIVFEPQVFGQKKAIEKQLMILGIEKMGGLSNVVNLIKEANKAGYFEYPNQATYFKAKIKDLMKTPKLTTWSSLVNELEHKIKIAGFVASVRNADLTV
jgi:hypothetical protein